MVNINYRLLPRVTLKIQVDDVLDGIIYIYEKSIRLNVNPRKIFLASDSTGSLLSLAALAFGYMFPTTVYTQDFHLLEYAHADHTLSNQEHDYILDK